MAIMSTVSLTNPGLIPIEAITTMGVSAKDGENPIGFFGTGLKYALAGLLRTSHKITIWRGLDRFDFETVTDTVRGKEFQFINMRKDGGAPVRLGFTTHLGAHWEIWQVFRELYSNCLDEAGDIGLTAIEPREGHTTIRVTGAAFAEAARDRSKVFLQTQPIYSGALVDIHPGRSGGIYYRGVLVSQLPKPSAFTYNLTTESTLTEDRTLKDLGAALSFVSYSIANCSDRRVLDVVLLATGGLEEQFSYYSPGEAFAEAALELAEKRGTTSVIGSALKAAEQWAQREARVSAAPLSDRERREVEDAKSFLDRIGYPITSPVIVAETLGADVFGMAKNDTIYLARVTLNRGGNFLIGTLLEEQLHITQGFLDESRRFQDFLIDLVVKFARDADHLSRAA